MKGLLAGLVIFFFATAMCVAAPEETVSFPLQKGYVNDYIGILPEEVVQNLESSLRTYHAQRNVQIVVVIMNLPEEVIGCRITSCTYGKTLITKWKIGAGKNDRGGIIYFLFPDSKTAIVQLSDSFIVLYRDPVTQASIYSDFYTSIAESVVNKNSPQAVMAGLSSLMNLFRLPVQLRAQR